jgi:hypothetical protein
MHDIRSHHLANGVLPRMFESGGLVVAAETKTNRPKGYLGSITGKLQEFAGENRVRVVRRIIDAADQIPADVEA